MKAITHSNKNHTCTCQVSCAAKLHHWTHSATYSCNPLNQLVQELSSPDIDKTFEYDQTGNLSKVMQAGKLTSEYHFNAQGLLERAITQSGAAQHSYNALGKRVSSTTELSNNTAQTDYLLDLTRPYHDLLALSTDNTTQNFIWGEQDVVSAQSGSETNYYTHDHLLSPLRLIGHDGASAEALAFDEFGVPTTSTPSSTNPFGYTGYQQDQVSELYFAQARYYSPSAARFISEDLLKGTAANPQSQNRYAYCLANPLVYVDRDGMVPSIAQDIFSAAVRNNIIGVELGERTGGPNLTHETSGTVGGSMLVITRMDTMEGREVVDSSLGVRVGTPSVPVLGSSNMSSSVSVSISNGKISPSFNLRNSDTGIYGSFEKNISRVGYGPKISTGSIVLSDCGQRARTSLIIQPKIPWAEVPWREVITIALGSAAIIALAILGTLVPPLKPFTIPALGGVSAAVMAALIAIGLEGIVEPPATISSANCFDDGT